MNDLIPPFEAVTKRHLPINYSHDVIMGSRISFQDEGEHHIQLGTVIGTTDTEIHIKWDDGYSSYVDITNPRIHVLR